MTEPKVSIISPCYNGEKYIPRFLESLVGQTYGNVEFFFIDDGSTDGTHAVFESYRPALEAKGWEVHYIRQENTGAAGALNNGLKRFTGEYLMWPDSDDILGPDNLRRKVEFLEAHKEAGIVYHPVEYVYENDLETVFRSKAPLKNADMFRKVFDRSPHVMWQPISCMARSSALLDAIPDRDIYVSRGGQNAQIYLPLLMKYPYGVIDEPLARYVVRKGSHSRSENSGLKRRMYRFDICWHTVDRLPCSTARKRRMKLLLLLRHAKSLLTVAGEKIFCWKKENGVKSITLFGIQVASWKASGRKKKA